MYFDWDALKRAARIAEHLQAQSHPGIDVAAVVESINTPVLKAAQSISFLELVDASPMAFSQNKRK
jgi:hypothetical protein